MSQDRFAQIRPYNDDEVRGVLDRLLRNAEFTDAITRLRFPLAGRMVGALLRPVVRLYLGRQLADVASVAGFQQVVEKYMTAMIEASTGEFTVSGLERLDPSRACLFIGNHRDIALDPAFVNYALYANGRDTVRIAIGDNLLTKDYAADLMRLNKSFIVRRSTKGPRQMLAALQELSGYIRHSLLEERSSIWIAQREGRAKDGWDRTEPAIIKMLCISRARETPLAEHVRALNIVPVSISYEWDPCDAAKARELYLRATAGGYEKEEHEDVASIARSITAPKGAVHVSFGEPLAADFAGPDEVAAEIDRQVMALYRVQASNLAALRMLHGRLPQGYADDAALAAADTELRARLDALPAEHRPYLIAMYANPLLNRAALDAL
ncbi:MAG: 1-acyl-sn-glycerol-3-phosphate acyltransferase [Pseudomonadales bacterium]|nr:1-acyl-sn-glycerol-3-phosphate acyltransferase [Pseudomonadales bacterium]